MLQNPSDFLLQNPTVLLQNTTVSTDCDNFITKCDSYYKMQRLLQIATEQTDLTDFIIRTCLSFSAFFHKLIKIKNLERSTPLRN